MKWLAVLRFSMFFSIGTLALSTNVKAAEDDSFKSYDSIVNELKASQEESKPAPKPEDEEMNWDDVALHGLLGLGTSFVSMTTPSGQSASGILTGVHIGAGVNLFSPKARAEAGFTNYSSEHLAAGVQAAMREYELRLVFLPMTTQKTALRMGAGLAGRYIDLNLAGGTSFHSSTPVSLLLLGFEMQLAKNVYVGPDLSYRSALISDTFDKSAWDATICLNAVF
jgi:hypothetical protein